MLFVEMWVEWFLQFVLISYIVSSPFLTFLFHKNIMKELWNDDLADRVTVRLYVISNIAAVSAIAIIREIWK